MGIFVMKRRMMVIRKKMRTAVWMRIMFIMSVLVPFI